MLNIIKNDTVKVISGNHKGKVGKVLKVYPKTKRIIVEKVHLVKRHTRPRSQQDQGGIIEKEASIHVSTVMLVCPKCGKPARTSVGLLADGKKVRVCKNCKEMLTTNE
jgi:large subunit ribosomal protein L24